jgi:hypothetical protein
MRRHAISGFLAALLAGAPGGMATGQGRERALEQIPELLARIVDSQQEIRAAEAELEPVVASHEVELADARRAIASAHGEQAAAEALVRYVEAYAARLEAQEEGLRSIEAAVVRMRADARELARAAGTVRGASPPGAGDGRALLADQFQGVAAGTAELAGRLGREQEAAAAGSVLDASWASQAALDLALPQLAMHQLGPDGASAFAHKAEALYARYQARAGQLRSERRAVRRILDLLIEQQLGTRLDALFADGDPGLGALVASGAGSDGWQDLERALGRALGLAPEPDGFGPEPGALDRLDRFARGEHRE